MRSPDTSAAFFEAKYQADEDPWHFATSASEQQRYTAILDSLDGSHFRQAFEPACSIGVLTETLAPYCEHLLAVDLSPTAARRAADRCARFPQVRVQTGSVQAIALPAEIDLLVLSELGYYFELSVWINLVDSLLKHCSEDCTIVVCHWLGRSPDHRTTGDEVHDSLRLRLLSKLRLERQERHETFRLDRYSRVNA